MQNTKYQRVLTNAALGFVSFGKILRLLPLVGSSPTTVTSNRFIQFSTEKGLCFADPNAKMCQQMAQPNQIAKDTLVCLSSLPTRSFREEL